MIETLWVEKYRPKILEDVILPDKVKNIFQKFIDNKSIPNLLLVGPPGIGKTTTAKVLCMALGCDYLVINGSLNGNIDTLRNTIANFASSVSFSGGRKYVILDEADYLTNNTQPALRNFMEEFSANCGFILTCNYKEKIIAPLQSRCSLIDYKISKTGTDANNIAKQFLKRLCFILDSENVSYDKTVLIELIRKYFPDWRKTINEIQKYSVTGNIDSGILTISKNISLEAITKELKGKNFDGIKTWVAETDFDAEEFYKVYFDEAKNYLDKPSIPQLVLILAKYQYQHAFVANPDINLTACLIEIAADCKFK